MKGTIKEEKLLNIVKKLVVYLCIYVLYEVVYILRKCCLTNNNEYFPESESQNIYSTFSFIPLLFFLTNLSFADWEIKKGHHRMVEVIEIKHIINCLIFSTERIKTESEQCVQGHTIS